jgi:methyltransferase (TIGR00027 family)
MTEPLISNVSDTARWVAVYRAWESSRPDALFKDPFADRLAGERGRAIATLAPREMRSGWTMVTRTKLMDDLILTSIAEGCDRVLNLAAGLDTRPYRLTLPPSLSWVEADLPALLDEKERLLASEKPKCQLTRERVDLSDARERSAFLKRTLAGATKALVITEGLLTYLDDDTVRELARELASLPATRWWILDIASPAILSMMQKSMGSDLDRAPMKFAPAEGVAFFESQGWKAREIRSLLRSAAQFRRVPLFLRIVSRLPEPDPRDLKRGRWGAVVRFERA